MSSQYDAVVVGLGRIGLPFCAALLDAGLTVAGVDKDRERVAQLARLEIPFYEPRVEEALRTAASEQRWTVTGDASVVAKDTPLAFIIVNTPSNTEGWFDVEHVESAAFDLDEALPEGAVIIVSSTVNPGDCGRLKDWLNHPVCYCPEFVALGDAVAGFAKPEFVLIGTDDEKAGDMVEEMYQRIVPRGTTIHRISLIDAEIAKIALNFSVSVKVTLANFLGEVCELYEGSDVDAVTRVVGSDPRIGHRYFKAGTPVGGPCFVRDIRAMEAYTTNDPSWFAYLVRAEMDMQYERLLERVREAAYARGGKNAIIGLMGMAFKMGTDSTIGSPGLYLWEHLKDTNPYVIAWDNSAAVFDAPRIHDEEDMPKSCDVLVWLYQRDMDWVQFQPGQAVIDPWRVLDKERVRVQGAEYIPFGRG